MQWEVDIDPYDVMDDLTDQEITKYLRSRGLSIQGVKLTPKDALDLIRQLDCPEVLTEPIERYINGKMSVAELLEVSKTCQDKM